MPEDAIVDTATSDALPIVPGQVIGERYLAGEVIGGGGMGVVFAGTHVLLGTPVAIKLIHSELRDSAEAVQRFVNEARTTAALKGEHIARVFDVGLLPSGEPYLVMERLEGLRLDEYLLERGVLAPTEAVDIVLQACEGLTEAHAAALVHRDIKPANLFLARRVDGQFSLKILDFGIAKQRVNADTPALTNPGKSLGSPWYMSPEQMLTPASVDQRADVWSLGVLLFELLTSKRPFEGESVPQVCASVLTASPPSLREYRADLSAELDAVVLHCLEKEPSSRFGSVEQLAQALIPFASLPTHGAGIALEDSTTSNEDPDVKAQRKVPSYASLTPLHSASLSPPLRRSWPLSLLLLVASLLLIGSWLHFLNPSWSTRSFSAAQRRLDAARLALPGAPRLAEDPPGAVLQPRLELVALLQVDHGALATPERERLDPTAEEPSAPPTPAPPLTPEQARERAAYYEVWLRTQGLTRLNDATAAPPPAPASEPAP